MEVERSNCYDWRFIKKFATIYKQKMLTIFRPAEKGDDSGLTGNLPNGKENEKKVFMREQQRDRRKFFRWAEK